MPVDEAALDAFLASDETGETEPEVEAPAAEPQVEEPLKGDTFDRAYVEKLRKESAGYRDRAKKYNDAFDGYEDEAVSEWLELANTLKNDPRAAAIRFKEIYEAIEEQWKEETPPVTDQDPGLSDNLPLTRQEFDRLMAERDKEFDLNKRVAQIEADARGLGYEPGSDNYDELLWHASRTRSGSVQEAHEKMQAKYQAHYDKTVAEIAGRPNPMVSPGGQPASGERKISSWDEANEALDQWLQSQ